LRLHVAKGARKICDHLAQALHLSLSHVDRPCAIGGGALHPRNTNGGTALAVPTAMTTVTRNKFVDTLSKDGGAIDLSKLSKESKKALKDNGVSDAKLKAIAGQDNVIRGTKEMKLLFNYIDEFDKNGDGDSIATEKGGKTTAAGALYGALTTTTDASRAQSKSRGAKRFEGDKDLAAVADGKKTLGLGSKGESVKKVQQSLIDMGYDIPGGASGTYDKDTKAAVTHFQREMGIGKDGSIGKETLGALKHAAPAPGNKLVRSPEYDKMFADGRLDTTIAVGYDEGKAHIGETKKIVKGLKADGYTPVDYSKLSDKQRTKLGLTKDRYDPNAQYFHKTFKDPKTGKNVDNVVRLVTPGTDGKKARASFKKAMEQDEMVIYSGHARYGTGPDFDDIKKGDGNFVVDEKGNRSHSAPPSYLKKAIKGRGTDLDQLQKRPKYQMLVMSACSTDEYLHNLRGGKFPGRDHGNTDIVGTTQATWVGTGAQHVLAFTKGATQRQNQADMMSQHNKLETKYSARLSAGGHKDVKPNDGYDAFSTSGFYGNAANKEVPK